MAADTLSLYGVNTKSNHTIYHYYKKIFLVPVGNLFFMSTTSKDMIYEIQKFKHLWCRLSWTDTKNRIFSVDCYISRHQKLIFNNKKLISPDLGPQGPDPIQPSLGCHWTTMVVVEPSLHPPPSPKLVAAHPPAHCGGAVSMLLHGTGRWRCTGGPGGRRQSLHASTPASLHARAPLPTQGGRICCDTIGWLAFA
jgi:hypothetical protein